MASRSSVQQNVLKVKKWDSAHATEVSHIQSIDEGRACTLPTSVMQAIADTKRRHEVFTAKVMAEIGTLLGKTDRESMRRFCELTAML